MALHSTGARNVPFAAAALLVLFVLSSAPLAAQRTSTNGLVKPPVIDKHDIRFIPLSVNGEPLQSWINNVVQDDYGFLWFGTTDGLYKYDGYTLKPYRHERGNPNTIADDSIAAVYKDRDGSLWIGSSYGGLDRLDINRDTFTHYRHDSGNPGSLANDNVNCVYRDNRGQLWVCTADGLDRMDEPSRTFIHHRHSPQDAGSLSGNTVDCVYEDRQGNLWVGTTWGLNKLDQATGRFSHFLHDPANPHSISNNYVGSVLEDGSGVLWVASPTGNGLSSLDIKTGKFTSYSFHTEEPSSQSVTGVSRTFEDRDGNLWICTIDRGLLKFDRDRTAFTRYSNVPGEPNSLPNVSLLSMLEDSEGEMWLGTTSGLSRFHRSPQPFVNYQHQDGNPNSLHNNVIWSIQADSQGFLWIGDEDGLNRLNMGTGQFTFYHHDGNDSHSLSYDKVAAIREDMDGTLWFGTYGGGLDRFDRKTGQFTTYRHNPRDSSSLSSDSVLSLLIDRHDTLWVGTQGGGFDRFDKSTGRFTSYLNDPINPALPVMTLFEDRAGMLWAGTSGQGVFCFNPQTAQITAYRHNSADPRSLSIDKVNVIREDRRGRMWIGTAGGLDLLDRSRGTFTVFTIKDGLPDNAVESILEDKHGFLWLGTHNGLSRFDPQTRTFHNYFESDGLPGNLLDPHGVRDSCGTSDGEMIFGSSKGVTVFDPDRISDNPYVAPVRLTDFLLFNKLVGHGKSSPLRTSIWATNSLMLTHRQSIFTLEFAALSYMAPQRNRYRYKLEGFETQWNEVDSGRRNATYTNLPAGKYTFRVQGSNNDGLWNTKGTTLAITVLPPWWGTWWFESLLALILAVLIFAAYRSRVKGLQLQTARLESQVAQRTHELQIAKNAAEAANQAKTAFLANMSHELRSPLNAILGFSKLLRESRLSETQRRDLDIINQSGEHLLTLIDDVLDMAKIDAGRIVIENAPLNLRELVHGVIDLMRFGAEEKGLALSLLETAGFCEFVKADGEKLRQVLINLISNAVKFTQHGSVTLRVGGEPASDSRYCKLVMQVQDTGIGIANSERERIFDPFVQAGKLHTQKGTGLGLAITKQYVELMGGTVQVESARGKGSLFRLEIPVLKIDSSEMPATQRGKITALEEGQQEYRVLIVEDQEENWLLLQQFLERAGFRTQVAETGASGIEKFRIWRPQFIWMDWRLPDMDGLEVTRRIRELEGGLAVKIAILSAYAFSEYRDKALAAGVDDFLSKPLQTDKVFDCLARHLEVRYVYQEAAIEKTASKLEHAELASLPPELRKELADAVVSLDSERIVKVIHRISEQDPALGSTLSQFAEAYTYSPIFEALQSCLVKS